MKRTLLMAAAIAVVACILALQTLSVLLNLGIIAGTEC